MGLSELIFGARTRRRPLIAAPPRQVAWRSVRPRSDMRAVRAWRTEAACAVEGGAGALRAEPGDMIVDHGGGDRSVVKCDIFERTYEPLGGGLYRKRSDIVLRYFTLEEPATIETLEGLQDAEPGDWIMQGVAGEMWPVPRDKALEKYQPV